MESVTIVATGDSNFKIRLIGHCIICLKKVSTALEEETTEKCEEQDYPEAAPKSLVSAPGFLATFHEIWEVLQNGSESDGDGVVNDKGRSTTFGISLEKVMAAGSQINVTFSRTPSPTICHQCFHKILAVENMMKVVRHQVRNIERLAQESRKEGKFAGRAEQIQKTLQVFTLEVDDRGIDEHLDLEDENDESEDNFVEEKPKPRRGRPPKPKPTISENSMDSSNDQEDNSMDCHQDDNTNNSEDKEDPDFQIKTEPQDSDYDDGGDDDGSNYSDEFLAAGSSAKSLRDSGGRLSSSSSKKDKPLSKGSSGKSVGNPSSRIRWQPIDLSDEDIARDWRLRCRKPQKSGCINEYYCAKGRACGVKVKKKILKNGAFIVSTNGLEHSNHREDNSYGLTMEQKEFVHKCLEDGVTGPKYILMSLKAKGFPVPKRRQVCGYLDRMRMNAKNKNNTSTKDKVGENKVDGQKEKEKCEEEKS